jgi:hypothetical protein
MDRDEALRIVRAVKTAWGPSLVRNDIRRPALTGEAAKGYERVYETLDHELISQADYLAAQDLVNGGARPGRRLKHDWMLVVTLAIQEVRETYYHEGPMPTASDLARAVSDRYEALKHVQIDEVNSDLRKWCAAVLKGFTD